MFDKKDTLKDNDAVPVGQMPAQQNVKQINEEDIHQMPEKFLPKKAGKRKVASSNAQKKVLILVVLLIFFLSALISGSIIYLKKYTNQEPAPETTAPVKEEETKEEEEVEEEILEPEEVATTTEEIVEEEEVATTTEEIVEEEEEIDIDADNDQLTLLEEELFGTDPDDDDSDKDGYKDASELMNLYSPIAPSQSLLDSGLVTIYKNTEYDYDIYMPTAWLALPVDTSLSQIKFLTDGITGEFIQVDAFSNDNSWDILQYKQALNRNDLNNYVLSEMPALISDDGLIVYTINDSFLYKIVYDTNNNEEENFKNVFLMMLKSFEVAEVVAEEDGTDDETGPGGEEDEGPVTGN